MMRIFLQEVLLVKKYIGIVLIGLLAIGLSACGNRGDEIPARDDRFRIAVVNHCEADIYGILYECYLAETPVSGGGVSLADKTAFKKSETVTIDFIVLDFPENADLSTVKIEFFLILDARALDTIVAGEQTGEPAGEAIAIDADYGNVYYFSLEGNAADGFVMVPTEKP